MSTSNLSFVIVGFVISALVCIFTFKLIATWESFERIIENLLVAFLPIPLLIFGALVLNGILGSPWELWNGARLAPTIALVHGYKLYYGADIGPFLDTIYGPINYLAYLPAAIAATPTGAIMIGISIANIFYFLPVIWVVLGEYLDTVRKKMIASGIFLGFWLFVYLIYELTNGNLYSVFSIICYFSAPILWINSRSLLNRFEGIIISLWGVVFFVLVTNLYPSLAGIPFRIHADAPSLGFCVLACAFLYLRKGKNNIRDFALSAVCVALAFWSKQQAVPLVFGLATYIYLADGKQYFWRYLICLGSAFGGISIVFLIFSDPSALILNTFTLPSNVPVAGDATNALLNAFREVAEQSILFIAIISFFGSSLIPPIKEDQLTSWLSYNRWTMFLITAIYMIPSSLLSRARTGGNSNNLAFAIYFLAIAATLILVKAATFPEIRRSALIALFTLSVTLLIVQVPNSIATFNILPSQHKIVLDNPQEFFYKYAKANPGKAFFPWTPLASVMGEGKLYHFDYGVTDLEFAGATITEQKFKSGIPTDMKFMVYPNSIPSHVGEVEQTGVMKAVRKYLPEVSKGPVASPEINLNGWNVYSRP